MGIVMNAKLEYGKMTLITEEDFQKDENRNRGCFKSK